MRVPVRTLAAALLWLGGCAIHHDAANEAASCVAARAEMPLSRIREYLLLPATLNGRAVQMVLDTGAEISTLSPGVAARAGLAPDSEPARLLLGVGGEVRTGSVSVAAFGLGHAAAAPARFSLNAGDLLPGRSPEVAGLLGLDLLGGRDLDLDAPAGRAAFVTLAGCPAFRPWAEAAGVPLALGANGLPYVMIDVDGRAVRALLDTGARETFMTRRLADAIGLSTAADPTSLRFGVSRRAIPIREHRVGRIGLGAAAWHDVTIGVGDVELPGADLLLGADLLTRQRVWISWTRKSVWVR